jgi:TolB-like protein/DNA-binding winged helix-turn-helix (wHTH) protein
VAVSVFEFGEFKLDCDRFELYRDGRGLKLERKPMELLILLVARNGHLVTRTEIAERLWGREVFVDTEHGINTAIRKIRQALRDDPDQPRFVQTVLGKGYRFVAEKNETNEANDDSSPAVPATAADPSRYPITDPILDPVTAPITTTPKTAPKVHRALTAALLLILVLAGIVIALNVGGVRNGFFSGVGGRARQIHSVAVIPLINLSGDASQDYFADGMTDEVITMLAKNTSLRVVSRTSVMQYKGVKRPLPKIARELGVDGILEGSIERSPSRVHMTVQLIYAPTDTHVWAESYDRDLNQAFLLPSELSQTIAKEVQARTTTLPVQPLRYISPEAHEAYLHGRYFWFTFDLPQTLPYFEKAIQLQPDYAAAWSGLADTYALGGMVSFLKPLDAAPKIGAAARKAVELDDSLPEAHNSMAAWYLFYAWDPLRADEECKRAIALNANYPEVHYVRHYVLLALNRPEEAMVEEKRAVELDPYSRPWGLGGLYVDLREYDAAISELRLQTHARPGDPWVRWYLSLAYWFKGMYEQSEQELEKSYELRGLPKMAAAAHKAWLQGGEKAVLQWNANNLEAEARKHYVSSWNLSLVLARTGEKDETMRYLEAAFHDHDPNLITVRYEPVFDFLHDDPRYQAILKQMELPPDNVGRK